MALRDLLVRIRGDKTHLDNTLDQSQSKIKSWSNNVGGFIKSALTVTAIVSFSKAIIGASEDLSDKFTAAITGARGALHEFFNTLATGNFSNFLSGITQAYNKAKGLAEVMDLFNDKKAFIEYQLSGMKTDSAAYESIVRDQTGKYSLETRKEYATKLKQIEIDIQKATLDIAAQTFEHQKTQWENTNKMGVDKAKEMYETIVSWSSEYTDEIKERVQILADELKAVAAGERGKTTDWYSKTYGKWINDKDVQLYQNYLNLMKEGETDVIPKLYAAFKTYQEATTQAQVRYNSVLRITNALLKEQYKEVANTPISPVNIPGIPKVAPGLSQQLAPFSGTAGTNQGMFSDFNITKEWKSAWESAIVDVTSFMSDEFTKVFESIGSGSFDDLGKDLLGGFGRLLSNLGKMLVSLGTTMLLALTLLKTPTIPTAIAAIAMGASAMAIGGLMIGAASKGANSLSGGANTSGASAGTSGMAASTGEMTIRIEGELRGDTIYWSNRRYETKLKRST